MTYEDYRTHLKVCEYLHREPTGQYRIVHDFLAGLWDGMEFLVSSVNSHINIQKNGEKYFELSQKKGFYGGEMMCTYKTFWSFFRNDMDMEYPDVQEFVKCVVEEHLKSESPPGDYININTPVLLPHFICEVGLPQ